MYLYWRIQQDLDCLGEFIVFHDPAFRRSFRQWMQRNASALAAAEGLFLDDLIRPSRN